MKKLIAVLFISLISFNCSNNMSKDEQSDVKKTGEIKSDASIKINQSKVHAKIEEVYSSRENNFVIKAKVLSVEENPAYASIAVEGNVYMLTPAFQLDENKQVESNSDRNSGLMKLSRMNKDDEFKGIIFYEAQKGWFIREVVR